MNLYSHHGLRLVKFFLKKKIKLSCQKAVSGSRKNAVSLTSEEAFSWQFKWQWHTIASTSYITPGNCSDWRWATGGTEEKTNTGTHQKAGSHWTGPSDAEAEAPQKLSVFITYSQAGRQDYYIQLTARQGYYIQLTERQGQGYYIQLKGDTGLLHTAEQGGRVITYSWTRRHI